VAQFQDTCIYFIIQNICQLNIKNWTVCVQDRTKWKNVVEKATTFNKRS